MTRQHVSEHGNNKNKKILYEKKQKTNNTTTTTEHLKYMYTFWLHPDSRSQTVSDPCLSQLLALNNRRISVKVVWRRDVERTLNDSLCLIPVCLLVIIAFVAGNISVLINHLTVEVHQSWPFSFFFYCLFSLFIKNKKIKIWECMPNHTHGRTPTLLLYAVRPFTRRSQPQWMMGMLSWNPSTLPIWPKAPLSSTHTCTHTCTHTHTCHYIGE